MKKKAYFNVESPAFRGTLGVFMIEDDEDVECIWAGKRFETYVPTCEENGFTSLQRRRGLRLFFEGLIPKVDFFPAPSMTLFAHDGKEGYFAFDDRNSPPKVYFVSEKLECWYLAEDFRTFVQMMIFEPNWKEKITGEMTKIHETPEEIADFGMLFGLYPPEEKLSENIYKDISFEVFENIEKMKEKCTLYEDIPPYKP
ncbi:MAG: hypothetical protein IKA89_05160 [Anaerotignum sp.]|nr:hypothetical protein [Anaerotignum sp.]